MCTLTEDCFKYQALIKYSNKEISKSQKYNLFAKDFGYKSYNSILKVIRSNEPDFDLKLLFPNSESKKEIDFFEEAKLYGFPDRYYSAQVDNDFFDEVLDFRFSEKDNFIYGKEFKTEEFLFSAKSIQFAIPSNIVATFTCQTFDYYGLLQKEIGTPGEEVDAFVESCLNKMVLNGNSCFTIGASSITTKALKYQHEKSISSIKNIKDAQNISFFVLNNIDFTDYGFDDCYLEESMELLLYAFIHRYMRFDYQASTSLIIEIPFSATNMSKEQFDTVEVLKTMITQTCEQWGRMFTKPVHQSYSEFDEDATHSYIFFTRKDIEGNIAHAFRDEMNCYQEGE